jgi:pimeloyl-ACP methyl ester carboxylesterase
MQVIVDGLLTEYNDYGNGRTILFIHGWGDNKETFIDLYEIFKKTYRLVSLDLPGFGKTENPKETFDLEKYANFISEFLAKIGVSELYTIIGHSNGGAIAIKAIGNEILYTKKLVLLASSGIRQNYSVKTKTVRIIAKILKVPTYILPKKTKNKLKKRVYNSLGSDMFIAENLQETFKKIVSEDISQLAKKIKCPTLLIYGSKDLATPPEFGKTFSRSISNSNIIILENSGHFVHHDDSEEVKRLICEFIDEKK